MSHHVVLSALLVITSWAYASGFKRSNSNFSESWQLTLGGAAHRVDKASLGPGDPKPEPKEYPLDPRDAVPGGYKPFTTWDAVESYKLLAKMVATGGFETEAIGCPDWCLRCSDGSAITIVRRKDDFLSDAGETGYIRQNGNTALVKLTSKSDEGSRGFIRGVQHLYSIANSKGLHAAAQQMTNSKGYCKGVYYSVRDEFLTTTKAKEHHGKTFIKLEAFGEFKRSDSDLQDILFTIKEPAIRKEEEEGEEKKEKEKNETAIGPCEAIRNVYETYFKEGLFNPSNPRFMDFVPNTNWWQMEEDLKSCFQQKQFCGTKGIKSVLHGKSPDYVTNQFESGYNLYLNNVWAREEKDACVNGQGVTSNQQEEEGEDEAKVWKTAFDNIKKLATKLETSIQKLPRGKGRFGRYQASRCKGKKPIYIAVVPGNSGQGGVYPHSKEVRDWTLGSLKWWSSKEDYGKDEEKKKSKGTFSLRWLEKPEVVKKDPKSVKIAAYYLHDPLPLVIYFTTDEKAQEWCQALVELCKIVHQFADEDDWAYLP